MPLTATFAADLSQFTRSLSQAQVELQVFDRATRTATRNLTRELENFSGQKVAAEAARMVEAVERVGGASKLTVAEQQRVNRVLEEATEKFRRLGIEAPKAMLDLAAATRQAERPLISVSNILTGMVAGATAAVTSRLLSAGQALVGFGVESLARGAQITALRHSFDNLSGGVEQSTATLQAMRKGSVGLVADLELLQAGNKAMLLGLGLSSREMGELARTATVLGRAMGQDATKSLDDLITALGRSSPLILDNLGLSVKLGEANEKYAEAIGKTVSQLTEAEKKQAFQNAALEAARAKVAELGEVQLTAAEAAGKLWTGIVNLADATANWVTSNRAAQGTINTLVQGMTTLEITIREGPLAAWREYQKEQLGSLPTVAAVNRAHQGLIPTIRGVALSEDELFAALQGTTAELNRATEAVKTADDVMRNARIFGGDEALAQGERMIQVLRELGGPAKVLPSQLKNMAQAFEQAGEAAEAMGLRERAEEFRLLARTMQPVIQFQQRFNVTIGEFVTKTRDFSREVRDQIEGWKDYGDTILIGPLPNTMKLFDTMEKFKDISMEKPRLEIQSLASTLGESFKEVAKQIPETIAQALVFGGSLKDAVRSLASRIGAALGGDIGEKFGGELGRMFGSAIGSLAGSLVNLIGKLITTPSEDIMRRVGRTWGVQISKGLADAIADEAKKLFGGNRQAAEIFNIDKIIGEAGGLSDRNINLMTTRLRDIFVMLETGRFTVDQATDAMNRSFGDFAAYWEDKGGLVSAQMLEIIQLTRQMGLESEAVNEFVRKQITGAASGLQQFFEAGSKAAIDLAANEKRLAELQAELARAGSSERARIEAEIARITAQMEKQRKIVAALTITTEQQARGAAAAIAAMFAELQRGGLSIPEALKAIQPSVEALAAQLEAAGLSGGEAFDQIRALAALAADEVAGPVLEAVGGLAAALEGLHNSGLLTQEMFEGLASSAAQAYNTLIEQGYDGEQVLRLMQPTLQRIWQLQQDFGYEVDETTQAMLDQAEAAGLVGDHQRDANERAARAMEKVAERLGTIIDRLFGVEEAGEAAARGIERVTRAAQNIPAPGSVVVPGPGSSTGPGAPTGPAAGPSSAAAAGVAAARAANTTVRVPVYLEGRQVAEAVVEHIPAALRRKGVATATWP